MPAVTLTPQPWRTTEALVGGTRAALTLQVRPIEVVEVDLTPPELTDISPTPGTGMAATTPVTFNVTDAGGGLRRVLLVASFSFSEAPELVHDGATFTPPYASHSTRTPVAGGYAYSLLRKGGWPSAFTLTPFAVDTAGNEAA